MRSNSTVIDLIRHGKPEGGKRYRGQIDVAYAAITRIKRDGERPPMLVSHAGCRV